MIRFNLDLVSLVAGFGCTTFLVVFLVGYITRTLPIPKGIVGSSGRDEDDKKKKEHHPSEKDDGSVMMILGSSKYDMIPITSPSATGWKLVLLSKLISNRILGPILCRYLINKNRPDRLRDLAQQAARQGTDTTGVPLCRTALPKVTSAMAQTVTNAIQKGLTKSYTNQSSNDGDDDNYQIVGVMDYYEAYRLGTTTPTQMMKQVLHGMDQLQYMKMFMTCHHELVLEQAKASDQRWKEKKPLSVFDGVPIAVKDYIEVKGHPMTMGKVWRDCDTDCTKDDIMIQRLRSVGAIIVGTTVMTEYGRCPLGYNSHYKGPFNPYDERCYSGGSSSGSVCSVMTGLVPIAISFDGGGSIRLPAAFSGAMGLAPTFGRIPFSTGNYITGGAVHAGVNTVTTTDTALAYAVLAQNEPNHPISLLFDGGMGDGPPNPHLTDFDNIDTFAGLRIGIFWDYFNDADPEIVTSCKHVVDELVHRGATIVDVTIPHLKILQLAHGMSLSMEIANRHEEDFVYRKNDLEPATMIQVAVGYSMTGIELLSSHRMRDWAKDYIKSLFANTIDIFVTPGCPITAPRIPTDALSFGESNLPLLGTVMRYVFLVNLAGFPGMTMPVGYTKCDNLPISLQVMADHWNDHLLLRLAHFVEKKVVQRKKPKHYFQLALE